LYKAASDGWFWMKPVGSAVTLPSPNTGSWNNGCGSAWLSDLGIVLAPRFAQDRSSADGRRFQQKMHQPCNARTTARDEAGTPKDCFFKTVQCKVHDQDFGSVNNRLDFLSHRPWDAGYMRRSTARHAGLARTALTPKAHQTLMPDLEHDQ
jgi:hypothetical protein